MSYCATTELFQGCLYRGQDVSCSYRVAEQALPLQIIVEAVLIPNRAYAIRPYIQTDQPTNPLLCVLREKNG